MLEMEIVPDFPCRITSLTFQGGNTVDIPWS